MKLNETIATHFKKTNIYIESHPIEEVENKNLK